MLNSISSTSRGERLRIPREAWTTDRVGRLLTGGTLLALMLFAIVQDSAVVWCASAAVLGIHLTLSSLFGWCPIHELLRGMGFKDREEVYAERLANLSVKGVRILESAGHETPAYEYDIAIEPSGSSVFTRVPSAKD